MRCNDERNAAAAFSLITPTNQSEVECYLAEPEISVQMPSFSEQSTTTPDHTSSSTVQCESRRGSLTPSETSIVSETSPNITSLEVDNSISTCSTGIPTVPQLSGPLTKQCDGRCGRDFTYASDMYWCKNCPDVQFDKACLDKVRCGGFDGVVCDLGHEFFYVPPWDVTKSKELRENWIDVGGDIMPIEQWITNIRKTWGLGMKDAQEKGWKESEEEANDDDDNDCFWEVEILVRRILFDP